ncbi:hypothetical protein [Streptosporangium sp. V21-05]
MTDQIVLAPPGAEWLRDARRARALSLATLGGRRTSCAPCSRRGCWRGSR